MASTAHFDGEHETKEARALRSARQRAVAPGGRLDIAVGVLSRVLPLLIGVLLAVMVITPLSPRGEVSFLLDRDKVGVIDERARVDNALYRGEDARGRPFSITAGEAVQKSVRMKVVHLADMDARLILDEGPAHLQSKGADYHFSGEQFVRMSDMNAVIALADGPARLTSGAADFFIDKRLLRVPGSLSVKTADGYSMVSSAVTVNFDTKQMEGRRGVKGALPAGTFSADAITVDLPKRETVLTGNARMRLIPGRLKAL